MGSHGKIYALPYGEKAIRAFVYELKNKFGLLKVVEFPIVEFIEFALNKMDPDFTLEVVNNYYFKDRFAETCPSLHTIRVSKYVYEGAVKGSKFFRMVLAHELGHYLMHVNDNVCFAKLKTGCKRYDIETQADIFATEIMMAYEIVKKHTPKEISSICRVPWEEAKAYKETISRELRQTRQKSKKAKKRKKARNPKRTLANY